MDRLARNRDTGKSSSLIRDSAVVQEALGDLVRFLRHRERDRAEAYGLPVSLGSGLLTLARDGPMTVGQLGETLFLEKSTASRLARGLLERDLVRKRSPRSDGRVVILQLTEKGHRLSRRMANELSEELREALGSLDPQTRQALPQVLTALTRALTA